MAKRIDIGGRLHSMETGNTVAGTDEILDDQLGKKQNVINKEAVEKSKRLADRLSAVEQLGRISVEGGEVEIANSPEDIKPGNGALPTANALFYALGEKSQLKYDREPTDGSESLVKSGDMKAYLDGKMVLTTEEEMEQMIFDHTWKEGVVYYTEEEE